MDIAVVWNARAGSATGISADDVRDKLVATTGRSVEVFACDDAGSPLAAARDAIAANPGILVAAGGDGTVSACATELIRRQRGQDIALGVLPMGTSNSFAAALGIPSDIEEALAQLTLPDRRQLDAAIVSRGGDATDDTTRVMILHCMIGLHAEAIADTSSSAKRRWGVLAYAATALRKLASLSPFSVELKTAQHVVRCQAVAVAAANIAPVKTVLAHGPSHLLGDDGRVDITIVAAETIAEAIATGVHLYRSAQAHEPATRDNVGSFSTAHLDVRTEPAQAVLVDGEPFGETPVRIETLPRALTVVAPPAAEASGDPIEASLVGLPDVEIERLR